jgi:transcriptional antiterminator
LIGYTVDQAASELGVSGRRVRALIASVNKSLLAQGRPQIEKHGRDWSILPWQLDLMRDRKPGRPSK